MVSKNSETAGEKYAAMKNGSDFVYRIWDRKYAAIWFAQKVNFEHYLVDIDSAMAYYVIPDEERQEETNQIRGSMQTDAKYVLYLRELCRTYLRQAVTPHRATIFAPTAEGSVGYKCKIEFDIGQQNISKVEVLFFDESKKTSLGPPEELSLDSDMLRPRAYTVETQVKPTWLKLVLYKTASQTQNIAVRSAESFFVKIEDGVISRDGGGCSGAVTLPNQQSSTSSKQAWPAPEGAWSRIAGVLQWIRGA
jgi:hypothetical protein